MKKETYINYIKYTLTTYNKANKKALLKLFEEDGIGRKRDSEVNMFDGKIIPIDYSDIDGSILECIEKNDKAIDEYNFFQFTRGYKYSVICETNSFDELLEKITHIPEYKYNDEINLFDNIQTPIRYEHSECTILLFNKKYEAIHPQTSDEVFLHYPVLLILHKEINLLEIRFDTVKRLFTGGDRDQTIYNRLVDDILLYIKHNYDIDIIPLGLEFMTDIVKKDTYKNIKLISQYMNLATGGKAQLAVGNNEEYVIPFLGELKNVMSELKEELDKNVKIKDALEQFIYEKEETTDYPWIEVLFLNSEGIKTRNNHVKFIFNYMNQGYTIISYYYNEALIGMERMNDVTRFIGENIKK